MNNSQTFYSEEFDNHSDIVKDLSKQLLRLSLLRLLIFIATGLGIYFAFQYWQLAVLIGVVGIVLFLFLLTRYTDLKRKRNLHKALSEINADELQIADGQFHQRPSGGEFQNSQHYYSLDIDLFGKGSFFQFINRTIIPEGTQLLANELTANNIKGIPLRQEAIKELSNIPKWRQYYSATASLVHVETPAKSVIHWLDNHEPIFKNGMRYVPLVFTLLSVGFVVLSFIELVSANWVFYWLLFGLFITGIYVKRINHLAVNTDKVKDTFRQYASLLNQIENESFQSDLLKAKQEKIQSQDEKASKVFAKLSKSLDALDNRNNVFSAIIGNGFFLTDIKNSFKIEQWIATYGHKVSDWFEVVSFFDAYNSLGNYVFNHPQYVFPKIVDSKEAISAKELGHPLLDDTKRVSSNLEIQNQEFFIVTGANMAGKSTFLRTVSLHIVMANVGLPVCATSSKYDPVKLITSMRTSDSLTDESSYFFSELTRLKFIVDEIAKEPYFIILDEILKGTNSTDKAIGSRKFVEKLVATNATGIIATHDLSLCEIESELKPVKNYYFDARIVDDELFFDYKFKKGICQNMNASFLLKKMEIV